MTSNYFSESFSFYDDPAKNGISELYRMYLGACWGGVVVKTLRY
jgi:hypothetical protein